MYFFGIPFFAPALLSDMVKIYADIFFIINLSMDLLLFVLLSLLLRTPKKPLRFFAAATVTAALPIAQMLLPGNEILGFVILMVTSFVSCAIAFENLSFIKLSLSFALFSTFSSIISALLTKLYLYFGKLELVSESAGGSGGIIPLAVCVGASALSALISYITKRVKKRRKTLKTTLTVISDQITIEMSAYCDSGNLLREPVGGLPVIITGMEKMKKIVPDSLHSVFFSSKNSFDEPSLSDARRVRIIPIMPVGAGGARILFGYVPDKIMLDGSEVSACIALDTGSSKFGGCEALLPNCLIK